ncbi:MAG: SDR family oxidoreductase [Oligoflexia bacterium]|nr:SDR family oxidoreductase [Oligoflexia bacterium]
MPENKPYALISGASSGIGYEIALNLADRGYDLLATGRDQTRLEQLRVECRARSKRQVDILVLDLGDPQGAEKLLSHWHDKLAGVEVLVNNAGFGVHGVFENTPIDREMELAHLQIDATLKLTKAVLGPMKSRRRGYILNVGSVYSFFPVPFQSVYGACKSFLRSFSEALSFETAGSGVHVCGLYPGSTLTAFRTRSGKAEKTGGMAANAVASIGCAGLFAGRRRIVPGAINRLIVFLARWAPQSMFVGALTRINRYRGVNH